MNSQQSHRMIRHGLTEGAHNVITRRADALELLRLHDETGGEAWQPHAQVQANGNVFELKQSREHETTD